MTPESLKNIRKSCGHSQAEMSKQLKTPYRTYQDWENGTSRIPGVAEVAIMLFQERDKWVTDTIKGNTVNRIARDYPNGIPSEEVAE